MPWPAWFLIGCIGFTLAVFLFNWRRENPGRDDDSKGD